MSTFENDMNEKKVAELEAKLNRLNSEKLIAKAELRLLKGQPLRSRERAILAFADEPLGVSDLARKLDTNFQNAQALVWRLRGMNAIELERTEQRGTGSASNIWRLVRY